MRARTTTAGLAALLVLLGAAAPASAVRPRCRIVTDRTGDATKVPGTGQSALPNQDDLDITSADLATDARHLTTVVRVRDLGAALSAAPRARQYTVFFRIGRTDYAASAKHLPDGDVFWLEGGAAGEGNPRVDPLGVGSNFLSVTGVFDVAHDEVRVTVPRGVFRKDAPVRSGTVVSGISAVTYQGVGAGAALGANVAGEEDRSDGPPARYVADTPSCLVPGR